MRIIATALSVFFTIAIVTAQTVTTAPSYTHKDDVIIGQIRDLPSDGWYVFGYVHKTGLYKTPLTTFDPVIIPGTEQDSVSSIDISENGLWIIYIKQWKSGRSQNLEPYMISIDGKVRVQIPVYPKGFIGFYRNSPKGDEVFVNSGMLEAIKINYDSVPSFSDTRVLSNQSVPFWHDAWSVWKDQIFGLVQDYNPNTWQQVYRTGYITIPENGNGIATDSSVFKWVGDTMALLWGCGQTMSHDGQLCAANSNGIGGPWVPNFMQDPPMDHKGFYITKFWRTDTDTPVTYNDVIDKYGISINWCPKQYRIGTYDKVGFSGWEFSNNNDYISGVLQGSQVPYYGIFLVHWKTNTWTKLTPDETVDQEYVRPAVFFPSSSPVKQQLHQSIKTESRKSGLVLTTQRNMNSLLSNGKPYTLYNINGRKTAGRTVPSHLTGIHIIQYQQ